MADTLHGLYTIPCGQHFLETLAQGLIATLGDRPEQLAQATILLPSRRSVRSLRAAFLQQTLRGGAQRALLLPRLATYGELDEDEVQLGFGSDGAAQVPPIVDRLERQWWLAATLRKFDANLDLPDDLGLPQSLRQADELARLLDQLQAYEVSEEQLHALVTEHELAEHWQKALRFLDIILREWPKYLSGIGRSDRQLQRAAVLRLQAGRWRDKPPGGPVIIAGVNRYEPAVFELLEAVLALPQGCVVLPGHDRGLDAGTWEQLNPVHPDFLLRDLIERLGTVRAEIALWPTATAAPLPERQRWLREAMRPSAGTELWRALREQPIGTEALQDITLVTAPNEQMEARAIALIVRQALETPGQTISLVTPDRTLARLVSAQLRRWEVEVDDSGGLPLQRTVLGAFLLLVVAAADPRASVHDILALGKHPYARGGAASGHLHAALRSFERDILHEGAVNPGLDGWQQALARGVVKDRLSEARLATHAATLARLRESLQPLCDALDGEGVAIEELLNRHLTAAESLAATDRDSGAVLWQAEEGECAARFFLDARLTLSRHTVDGRRYRELLQAWFAPLLVRRPIGQHPRVTINSLIDARLTQADVTILGGLNEGVWPPPAPVSPFLSRGQHHGLGLPDPESRIGQAAHDFVSHLGGGCIYLTRATRVGGTPTVAARWLLRLAAVLTETAALHRWQASGRHWVAMALLLDRPDAVTPLPAPAPRPPIAARPDKLSVTQVERWLRDPYGLYAEKILRLRGLAPLTDTPGARERGELVHGVLERFTRATLGRQHATTDAKLLDGIIEEVLAHHAAQPALQTLYRVYLQTVSRWFLQTDAAARSTHLPWQVECDGSRAFSFASGVFTLTARADRIDADDANGLVLIDYKTGTAPSPTDMQKGRALQLTLSAAIATQGGFGKTATVDSVAYWQSASREQAGAVKVLAQPALAETVARAEAALGGLVDAFADAETAYLPVPLPDRVPRYNDYAHLERTLEWAFAEDPESAGGSDG